jgi:hypothetical protein
MRWKTYERYLRNQLAQQLKIPIVGKIYFAFREGSSTSNYEEWLRTEMDIPAELAHQGSQAPALAFAETTANRNDVVIVFPGAFDLTSELAWNKNHVHLVGAGGPNVGGDWSEPNVCIYTDSIDVASVITVTGANCQFHNANVFQYGNNSACLTAFTLNKYGCVFKNFAFMGVATAGVDDVVAAASLYIAGNGMYPLFEDCIIGQDVWDEREGANSGQLRFTGTTQTNGGQFLRCRFLSRSNTATVAMVALPANGAIGRGWRWIDCTFYNLAVPHSTNLNQVFYDNDAAGQTIILQNCTAVGFDEWQDQDRGRIFQSMPAVDTGGGLVREPTATVYAGTDR